MSLTRVEIRLTGKKRPIDNMLDMNILVQRILTDYYNPFDRIFIREVVFTNLKKLRLKKDIYKLAALETLAKLESLQIAKKRLNKHNNFLRDFTHLYKFNGNSIDLGEIFKMNICKYFSEIETEEGSHN